MALRQRIDTGSQDAWVLVPLRLFLGLTFIYAGLQKMADRWFFKAAAPSSLQAQLHQAVHDSPIGGLISPFTHLAVPLGLLIAVVELMVGLGVLLGLWTRAASAVGLLLSLGFLLAVSWHTRPFYYGADVVFVFAWTPLLIAGAGRLSLDHAATDAARHELGLPSASPATVGFDTVQRLCGHYDKGRCRARGGKRCGPVGCPVLAPGPTPQVADAIDRRTFLTRGLLAGRIGAAAVGLGAVAAVVGRLVPPRTKRVASAPALSAPRSTPGSTAAPEAGPTTAPAAAPAGGGDTPPGTAVGTAANVSIGGAAQFTDPSTQDPAFVLQPIAGKFVGLDATCPHRGCPVDFTGNGFSCPCHGALFDSAGRVTRGPAQQNLRNIPIHLGPDGQLYVQ